MREQLRAVAVKGRPPSSSTREEFERVYRRNIDVLTRYFARRCREPQTVADLTSETIVRAVSGFAGHAPRRGPDRAWLLGIASRVFARHCEPSASGREAVMRLEGHRVLDEDEIDERGQSTIGVCGRLLVEAV
jgi:DNA-directed RNA polymerase specialized sigma24 family protein